MNRRFFVLGLPALAAMTACTPLPRTNPLSAAQVKNLRFSAIEVVSSSASFTGNRAETYSSRIGPELRAVLTRQLRDLLSDDGVLLSIELQRLNLTSATKTAFGSDQSSLEGAARVVDPNGAVLASYPIKVIVGRAKETTTGAVLGATINSPEAFYRQLLRAFGRDTREQMIGDDWPGEAFLRDIFPA